jgi:hypothetical protein
MLEYDAWVEPYFVTSIAASIPRSYLEGLLLADVCTTAYWVHLLVHSGIWFRGVLSVCVRLWYIVDRSPSIAHAEAISQDKLPCTKLA